MTAILSHLLVALVPALTPLFPSPHDKDGWGLRIGSLSVNGPYLVGERISGIRFDVILVNPSKETREHDPIVVARSTGALQLSIVQPDGKELPSGAAPFLPRDPFTQPSKLPAGQYTSLDFRFSEFGYDGLRQPGTHRIQASWKIDGRTVKAPPVVLEVLDPKSETVLAEHAVSLNGYQLKRPPEQRSRPFVQQLKVGDRTLLIYRRFTGPKWGGGIEATFRLAELPGKCEMTVSGAFGSGRPLTITYKTSPAAEPTKLVINSANGLPWTEEEERVLQERLKREAGKSPPDAPAPKPVKP